MKKKENDFISLATILEKATTSNEITLPTVQRGFVWKPYQIENLWDSLLRGYPVGSFVLSNKINSENQYELLDGQQRASAICLGFYNPLLENRNPEIFKTSNENIMIFIDLMKPDFDNDNRKYFFRVITKSHPWGYNRQENQKVLESNDRNDAMRAYKIENNDYFNKPLKGFWPYDSYKPIPFGLFMNAKNKEDVKKLIQDWKKYLKVEIRVKANEVNTECYSENEIYDDVQKMLKEQSIPRLFLDTSHLYLNEKTKSTEPYRKNKSEETNDTNNEQNNDNEQRKIEDRNISEVENLFIRLNSGGTPLRGEELNYSILKAHILPDLQIKIEDSCKGIFYPARFITIAFRLFNNINVNNNTNDKDSIRMTLSLSNFNE